MAIYPARPDPDFPIVEGFGFPLECASEAAQDARARRWCPFSDRLCEKQLQYGFGYCSVRYAAERDGGDAHVYSVCDHRLDGAPVYSAIVDWFKERAMDVTLVDEVVLTRPRVSFDYVAFLPGAEVSAIAIETQAIDIRGGGVGPAWRAWAEGRVADWRQYFTEEARRKGRPDTVAYGVNMANIYKRLGMQVAVKARFLKRIGVPLYVVMQDRPFRYLKSRIQFAETPNEWDITFLTFDYTGRPQGTGSLEFEPVAVVRTTVANYVEAVTGDASMEKHTRESFLGRVERKARSRKNGAAPETPLLGDA